MRFVPQAKPSRAAQIPIVRRKLRHGFFILRRAKRWTSKVWAMFWSKLWLIREWSKTVADLYRFDGRTDRQSRTQWREKSATKLIEQIEKSKTRGLQRLALRFGHSPRRRTLRQRFSRRHLRSIENLAAASVEQLDAIPEIGLSVAESVYHFFRHPKNTQVIERLKSRASKLEIDGSCNRRTERKFRRQNLCFNRKTRKIYPRRSRQTNRRSRRKSFEFGQQKNRFCRCRKRCGFKTDESRSAGRQSNRRIRICRADWLKDRSFSDKKAGQKPAFLFIILVLFSDKQSRAAILGFESGF